VTNPTIQHIEIPADHTPLDTATWIMRTLGASREDADRVMQRVADEAMAYYADHQPATTIANVGLDDQIHAAVQRVSAAVAAHYKTLREAGMPDKRAAQLCAQMQEQWLAGVLPMNEAVVDLMREDAEGGL